MHILGPAVVQRVALHSRMAKLFVTRQVCILEHIMDENKEKLGPREPPVAKPRWELKRAALRQALQASGHHLTTRRVGSGKVVVLRSRCLAVRRSRPGLLAWLRAAPCVQAEGGGAATDAMAAPLV